MRHKRSMAYLAVLAGSIVLFHIVGFIKAERSPIPISSHASIPNYALQNARIYLTDKEHSRSLLHLKEAVRALAFLHDKSSGASQKKLATGLAALREVEREMETGAFNSNKLNESSVIANNALIYYEIASAKEFIQKDQRPEAMKAISFGIEHLRSALDFAKGDKKEYEVQIFSYMDDIKSNYYMDKSQMVEMLDEILNELEDLDVSYSNQ